MILSLTASRIHIESPWGAFGHQNMKKLGWCAQEWAVSAMQRVPLLLQTGLESLPARSFLCSATTLVSGLNGGC